jgi:hypothetical protein
MHPGGAEIIIRHAGTDVKYVAPMRDVYISDWVHSTIFKAIHSPNVLKMLSPEQCVGNIDVSLLPSRKADIEEEKRIALAREQLPLVAVVNLHDFEASNSCL